jgi:hypothetical protein
MSVVSRLFIAPIVILGPIGGFVLAGLLYGSTNPGVLQAADQLRHAIMWVSDLREMHIQHACHRCGSSRKWSGVNQLPGSS